MPTLTLFVGVNGAGKSTLFNLLNLNNSFYRDEKRVNPDEILTAFNGDWRKESDTFKSARYAFERIQSCLESRSPFNWETTIVTNFVLKTVKKAKSLGYDIHLFFVTVNNVDTALSRIEQRVQSGGHGVPEDLVRYRFANQFCNIDALLKMTDWALFFDNTSKLRVVGQYSNKQMTVLDRKFRFLNKTTENKDKDK